MKKNGRKRFTGRLCILLAGVLLFFSVFSLMNYVKYLLNSDTEITLTEIATQNKDVIASKLQLEVNNVGLAARQVEELIKQKGGEEHIVDAYKTYMEDANTKLIFVALADGTATFRDGRSLNVSGRYYFRKAMEGNQNISDKITSRLDGEEVFIISSPIYYEGEVVATLQEFYSSEDMYNLCRLSLFSSQGYMYIINSEGYILINTEDKEYGNVLDNYYRMLFSQGNKSESEILEKSIKENKTGFLETTVEGEKVLSAYTPIEGVHDWYLISSIANKAVSPNGNIVIQMFYFILCFIIIVFALSLFYFLSYKNKQQARLSKIAFVDPVTNGNTYNKFTVHLQEILATCLDQDYYLLVMDIDNFKYINSYYGFDVGDRILYQSYHAIKSMLKEEEDVCRISSDHFVLLLKDASLQRLHEIVAKAIMNEEGLRLYFTAGVYPIKDRSESTGLMLDKASAAAHASKDLLHKRIQFYDDDYEETMIHNEQLKREVEKGLANSEMIPFFQPKVDVRTNALVGAEALARWKKEDGTLIPPFEFISVCEKTGMIVDLDFMIFEKTLQFLRKNIQAGITCVPISVNFSRVHLFDETFVDDLLLLLQQYEVPAKLIEIEITESVWLDNHDVIKDFIQKIHDKGLQISMDDFGSGYSSLNMLKDVRIDVLKIDQVFLQTTNDEDRQKIILSTIVKMARDLDIKVVMEGVETLEQVTLMKDVGCFIAQGYYYAKPMDVDAFIGMYQEGSVK